MHHQCGSVYVMITYNFPLNNMNDEQWKYKNAKISNGIGIPHRTTLKCNGILEIRCFDKKYNIFSPVDLSVKEISAHFGTSIITSRQVRHIVYYIFTCIWRHLNIRLHMGDGFAFNMMKLILPSLRNCSNFTDEA